MSTLNFEAVPYTLGSYTIIRIPTEVSQKFGTRNIVMVHGTLNAHEFKAVLEPDGWGSHWLHVNTELQKMAGIQDQVAVQVVLEQTKEWIEPNLPNDFKKELTKNTAAYDTWNKTTTMAHWEWLRWIRATNNTETRQRRIAVACSKLQSGMRRPCCFNTSACTFPEVSKNGALLEPEPAVQ